MQYPNSKLPNVGTTIFTKMSLLAQEHNAINLSQGFPDFLPDEKLLKAIGKYAVEGFNQYAPLAGVLQLRERIAQKIEYTHKSIYHPDSEITITAGATQALFTSIAAFISPLDEVILFEPAYDCYEPTIQLFGGIPVRYQMEAPDFEINWEKVGNLITEKTKCIILNNPNNPSGRILKEKDIQELTKLVKNTGITIISDEVYENITFDNKKHVSLCSYPELKERTFLVASFGKLCHITGWKIGYVAAPKELMSEFRKVHQFNVFSVNTPAQMALAEYLENEEHYLYLNQFFQEKRDFLRNGLSDTSFSILDCEGTYFQAVQYNGLSDLSDMDFAIELTKKYKVATIPFSAFYHDKTDEKVIRLCFAKKKETLEKAIENLRKISF